MDSLDESNRILICGSLVRTCSRMLVLSPLSAWDVYSARPVSCVLLAKSSPSPIGGLSTGPARECQCLPCCQSGKYTQQDKCSRFPCPPRLSAARYRYEDIRSDPALECQCFLLVSAGSILSEIVFNFGSWNGFQVSEIALDCCVVLEST